MLMRRHRIMRGHSFAVTFMECHKIIRGISNIASLVRTCLQQWNNMQKRIFLCRCTGSYFIFFFLRRIVIVYTCPVEYKIVSGYHITFVFARCSARSIYSRVTFRNVIRGNNIYVKDRRNSLEKNNKNELLFVVRCKPRARLQRKLKYKRMKSIDKTRDRKILHSVSLNGI